MTARYRLAFAGVTFGALASASIGCAHFSKGSGNSSAVVAHKVERLTFVSTAGQRCEVDAVTYAIIKPGEVFTCNWGGTAGPAGTAVSTGAPQSLEPQDPSKPESQSPWWWPFKKATTSSKPGTPPKTKK